MASWDEATNVEADVEGTDASVEDAGANFELAHIETIDVTRDMPKDSQQALVRRIRSQWDISFPQAMLWGILACAAGFAVTIVRERKRGTFLRMQVAPVSRAQVLAGKALACFVAVISVIALMVALGIGMGMRPENPSLLVAAAVCTAFAFAGIMMLMSVLGKTEEGVSGAAWGGNMLMAMFGGGMMPLVFMPSFMKTLSDFSPAKWSVLALEGAIWRGFSWSEMLLPCGILVAVGAVCLGIGTTVLSRATN
jgi:ABC-2 type transport system permease protein